MKAQERAEVREKVFGVMNAFDSDNDIFVISPDRLGFGFICNPLTGFSDVTQQSMNSLLNTALPTGSLMQFVLYASPDLEGKLHQYMVLRQNQKDETLQGLARARVEYLRSLTGEPISKTHQAKLRNMQLYMTVQVPHGKTPPNEAQLARLTEQMSSIKAGLKTAGFRPETMTAKSYKRVMETILNHSPQAAWRAMPWSQYDEDKLLCDQLLDLDTCVDIERNKLHLGEFAQVRVMSVKHYPDDVYPGMAMKYVGDLMRGTRALREPTVITVNIIYPDPDDERAKLFAKNTWATKNADGPLSKYIPDYGKQKQSSDIAVKAVNDGDRMIRAYVGAAVFAQDSDSLIQASSDLKNAFQEIGFSLQDDAFMVGPMFFQMLPFAASADMEDALGRYKLMPTRHCVAMLPLVASWSGTGTPMLTLFGRDGQLMSFSPYDSDGNYNFLICAQSGMGKSFLANALTTNFLSMGGRAWIIDKGFSYKQICEFLDGQYIEFDSNSNVCMNPFSGVRSYEEEADILCGILTVMAAPSQGLSDFQLSGLKRTLKGCWDKSGTLTTVDMIADLLIAEDDKRLNDIGHQLFSFTSAGEFGRYFNGVNNLRMDARMVVLELQQLSGRMHLQRVVLLQLLNQIQQAMDGLPRDMPKLLLVDEAFALLASNETQKFIETFYRQIRKFGGSAGICTQSVNDLYVNAGAIAMVENSAHMLLLGQKKESIAQVKKESRLELGEVGFRLLATVHTVPGDYSEILINNAFGIGIGRLVVSDVEKLMFSSKAQDVMAIKSYRDKGMNLMDAIYAVLRDRGIHVKDAAQRLAS
ncbi:type IV secretion system protein TraC (plasmid) [Xanthomonas sp. NCPPB 3583]|uniref:type IV secretion system protein TraC n=1 Tax=Xanthomonas sp. NCPPB 3583 TaxID=487558 RepID=UPI0035585C06